MTCYASRDTLWVLMSLSRDRQNRRYAAFDQTADRGGFFVCGVSRPYASLRVVAADHMLDHMRENGGRVSPLDGSLNVESPAVKSENQRKSGVVAMMAK